MFSAYDIIRVLHLCKEQSYSQQHQSMGARLMSYGLSPKFASDNSSAAREPSGRPAVARWDFFAFFVLVCLQSASAQQFSDTNQPGRVRTSNAFGSIRTHAAAPTTRRPVSWHSVVKAHAGAQAGGCLGRSVRHVHSSSDVITGGLASFFKSSCAAARSHTANSGKEKNRARHLLVYSIPVQQYS